MVNFSTRLMQIEDYEAVYRLWSGIQGMGMRSLDDSQSGISRFLKRNPNTCFVAEKDSQIVGVILEAISTMQLFCPNCAARASAKNC